MPQKEHSKIKPDLTFGTNIKRDACPDYAELQVTSNFSFLDWCQSSRGISGSGI